jgi:hypothetical protein
MRGYVAPALLAVMLLVAAPVHSRPPFAPIRAPGPHLGETKSEWLLPYVRYQLEGVVPWTDEDCGCCPVGVHSVKWYSEKGDVLHELTDVRRSVGFLHHEKGFIGLWPYWEMPSPRKGNGEGSIRATPTGRVLLHLYHPTEMEVAVDVYRTGRLTRTIGPYPGVRPSPGRFELNDSGAFCLLIGDHQTPDSSLVVLVNPDGKLSGEFKIPGCYPDAQPDPAGQGVIYRNVEEQKKYWVVPGEAPVPLDAWTSSSHVTCWVADRVLFNEWYKDGRRFTLVNLRTGRSVWWTKASEVSTSSYQMAATDQDWIFLCSQELDRRQDREKAHHVITVVNAADGDTLHVWKSSSAALEPGRLLRVGESVYFFTPSEFTRLDREAISAGRYGWRASREPDDQR